MFFFNEFQDLLSQQTADKQPILFLKDVTFVDLRAIVDYMYRGEVSISVDRFSSFLHTAEALKIRGELIVMYLSTWRVLNQNFFVGLNDKQIQPTNNIASQFFRASRQQDALYPLPTPSPELCGRSTSTLEEDTEAMPKLQEFQPIPLPIITPIATIEEVKA